MPAIGLFDLDGSLADHDGALLRDLQKIAGPNDPPLSRDGLWGLDTIAYLKARIDMIRSQTGWWRNLQPIHLGFQVLHEARRIGFCCQVLTKGPRTKSMAWKEKVEWCQNHLGDEVQVHIVMDKGLAYGKFLYDDYPSYMLRWLEHRPRGLGIMPQTPYNKDFTHPQVLKLGNGEDGTFNFSRVQQALQQCYERQQGEPLKI